MLYDNGGVMVGNIDLVIKELKREIEENIDMGFVDTQELLKDLEKLKDMGNKININVEVVSINYDLAAGYSIDFWTDEDKINI